MFCHEKIKIVISSPPDRERLVAEFFYENEQWAELNYEKGIWTLEIYPKRSTGYWQLDFDEVMTSLNEGKKRLLEKSV